MSRRSGKHPYAHARWWQIIPLAVFCFGGFGVFPAFVPPFSMTVLKIGLVTALIGVIVAVWNWRAYSWWSRLIILVIWSLQLLAIAGRAWAEAIPNFWIWLLPILMAYLLAWLLPAIQPRLSAFLWREQTTPQTRLGRTFLGLMLTIAPVAGVLGASAGMFGSRFGELGISLVILSCLMSVVAIGIAFAASYQLWPERPWAAGEDPRAEGI